MKQGSSPPATKEDIGLVKVDIGLMMERVVTLEMKVDGWREEMLQDMTSWKEEIKEHFDLVAENLHYDLVGIYKDRTEDHEQRIQRLERKTGLAV